VKDLVEYIAKSLVDDPTQVEVNEVVAGSTISMELQVARSDMGRVIGKRGRVANAMRALLRVPAARQGKRVHLDVIDPQ